MLPPEVQFALNHSSPAVNFNDTETKLRIILKSNMACVDPHESFFLKSSLLFFPYREYSKITVHIFNLNEELTSRDGASVCIISGSCHV
jgi:hypothetical protein